MANLVPYSPYNKSFKFICFQNKAYHEANKLSMKPVVRTNIRRRSLINPQLRPNSFLKDVSGLEESNLAEQPSYSVHKHMSMSQLSQASVRSSVDKIQAPIHKNASFQKFQRYRISRDNKDLVKRLLNTNCQVITNRKCNKSFEKHLKYKDIRRLYDSRHVRKQQVVIPVAEYLCPTLSNYHQRTNSMNDSNAFSNANLSELFNSRPETTRTSCSKRKQMSSDT